MCFLSVLNATVAASDLHQRHQVQQARSSILSKPNDHTQQQLEQQNQVAESILQQILKLEHPFIDSSSSASSSSLLDDDTLLVENQTADIESNSSTVGQVENALNPPQILPATTIQSLRDFTCENPSSSSSSSVFQLAREIDDEFVTQHAANANDSASAAACLSPLVQQVENGPPCNDLHIISSPPPACSPTNTAPDDPPTSPCSTAPSCDDGMSQYVSPHPYTPRRSKSAEHATVTPVHLRTELCPTPPPRPSNSTDGTPLPCWLSSASYRCTSNRRATSDSSSSSSIPLVVLRALQSSRGRRENAKPHTPIRIRSTSSSPPSPFSPSSAASYFQHCTALPIASHTLSSSSPPMSAATVYVERETDDEEDDSVCESSQFEDASGDLDELKGMFEAQQRMDDELKRQKQERRRIDSWKRDVRRNWNFDIVC